MRKFIYPFAMMAGLIIASSCTENEAGKNEGTTHKKHQYRSIRQR